MRMKHVWPAAVVALALAGGAGPGAQGRSVAGAVYVATNGAAGNEVLVFDRAARGTLTPAGSFATGGLGTGGGLGNQAGLVMSEDERYLFVVNAGSDELSVLGIDRRGLTLVDKVYAGGTRPISVAVHRDLVYVLNAGGAVGGADSIVGFRQGPHGRLTEIAGSSRPLSADNTGPAQIGFTPDGGVLVVTEKATNAIVTYVVGRDGLASGPIVHASSGATPFGFGFGKRDALIVSEAFGGALDASAVSSYLVGADGSLTVVTPSLATTETAACWIVVSGTGRFAYTTNAGSGTIAGFAIDFDGALALVDADGATGVTGPGSVPLDMALSRDGRSLYSLNGGNGTIGAFSVGADGSLQPLPFTAGLPAGANGMAAR